MLFIPRLLLYSYSHKHNPRHHHYIIISLKRPTPEPQQNPNPNFITTISKFLWGPSLPPQLLISAVRSTWSTTWQIIMSQLAPSDPSGSYTRPISQFRAKPNYQFSRQNPKSLHLYVGLSCPWAHRTLIVRALKGLQDSIPVSIASPGIDGSWVFLDSDIRIKDKLVPGSDNVNGCTSLREVYKLRCGFAQSQEAYDKAVNELFDALDLIDDHLGTSRYLCGEKLTLSDVCLFTTLIRFDIVYTVLFKCTKKKLVECPNLHGYMRDIYQIPEVAATCNLEAVMDGYYKFLFPLNPGNIRPIMRGGCEHDALLKPHNIVSLSVPEGVQVYIT